jgi:hypothetical protein
MAAPSGASQLRGGGNATPFGQIMSCAGLGAARLVVTHRSGLALAGPGLTVWAGTAGGVADGDGDLRVRKSSDCRIAAINDDCLRREIARNI